MSFLDIFKRAKRKPSKAIAVEDLGEDALRAIAEAEVPDEIEYMDEEESA